MFRKIPQPDAEKIANSEKIEIPCWCRLDKGEMTQTAEVRAYGPKFDKVRVTCPKCGRYTTGPNISEALEKWDSDKWHLSSRLVMAYRDSFRYMFSDNVDRGAFTVTMGSILLGGIIIGLIVGCLIIK